MRLVRITIEYDMDDLEKSLHDELVDWLDGNVNVQDLFDQEMHVQWATPTTIANTSDMITTIRINELDSQGEVQ